MSRPQCPHCQRPLSHCLCALIPSLDSRTRLLILQHPSEANHALNTARLAVSGLRRADLWVAERFEGLQDLLADPSWQALLLFPGDQAIELEPAMAAPDRPCLLIVPDGTWRKARKLLHLNPELSMLPRVTLPGRLASRYRLRKAPMPGALSTIEAVVQALNILETPANFDELLRPFDALIEGQIRAMGRDTYERNHCSGETAQNACHLSPWQGFLPEDIEAYQ